MPALLCVVGVDLGSDTLMLESDASPSGWEEQRAESNIKWILCWVSADVQCWDRAEHSAQDGEHVSWPGGPYIPPYLQVGTPRRNSQASSCLRETAGTVGFVDLC